MAFELTAIRIGRMHDFDKTVEFIYKLGLRNPLNPVGNKPSFSGKPEWYTKNEIRRHLTVLSSTFSGRAVWFNLPEFRRMESEPIFEYSTGASEGALGFSPTSCR